MVQELHGRRRRRGSPASLYPHPVRSAHAHATLILEKCKSRCRLGRRLIAVTEFPTVIIPGPGSQPSPVPCSLAARAAVGAGAAPLVRGGGCASSCQRSRCAPSASGFQLRRPSPGSCGRSLFKSMNHRGAHGKSFYRHEHIVSIPAELFGGGRWGRWDVQLHPVWGRHSSWGKRALAPTLVLCPTSRSLSLTRSPRTRNFKEAECAQTQSCPQIIFFFKYR